MNIEVIKTTSHTNLLRDLFRNMTNMITKEEINQRLSSNNINDLYHLVEQYRTPVFNSEVLLAHFINLIAQIDLKKAEFLIRQIDYMPFAGLFGLRISDKHFEFRHVCKLYIYSCDIDCLTIHSAIFSDFAVDVEIKNSIIDNLVIYFNVLNMLNKSYIEECILEYLDENRVVVENLQIKFE